MTVADHEAQEQGKMAEIASRVLAERAVNPPKPSALSRALARLRRS